MRKLALLLLLVGSCDRARPPQVAPPTSDLGTGLNTVDRKYARPAADVFKAASMALKALELKIESEKADALGGEITARRATDDKVAVTVKSIDSTMTSVSVRVAPGDRNMANSIHAKIAAELGTVEPASTDKP